MENNNTTKSTYNFGSRFEIKKFESDKIKFESDKKIETSEKEMSIDSIINFMTEEEIRIINNSLDIFNNDPDMKDNKSKIDQCLNAIKILKNKKENANKKRKLQQLNNIYDVIFN